MENCLKRRDHSNSSDLEDEENSDMEGGFQDFFLLEDHSRSHEDECSLISPYKRLRVEELTHSSAESQAGEDEAHSLLKSTDETDIYNDNNEKINSFNGYEVTGFQAPLTADVKTSQHRRLVSPDYDQTKYISISNNSSNTCKASSSQLNTINEHSYETQSKQNEFKSTRMSKVISEHKDASSLHTPCDGISGKILRVFNPANIYDQSSGEQYRIPYIGEICMENESVQLDGNQLFQPSVLHKTGFLPRCQSRDYLRMPSYDPNLQTSKHERVLCYRGVDSSNFNPSSVLNHQKPHLLVPNNNPTESPAMKFSESVDLELHGGSTGMREDGYPNSKVQTLSYDKEVSTCDYDDHYQTIDDMDVEDVVASSKHSEITGVSDLASKITSLRNSHSYPQTSHTANNDLNYVQVCQSRSIGTSCLSIPPGVRKSTVTTDSGFRSDIIHGSSVYAAVDEGLESTDIPSRIKEVKKSPNMIKSTVHSGTITATNQEIDDSNREQRIRYHSHQETSTSSSRCLGSYSESLVHGSTQSSWDNEHERYNEEYQFHQGPELHPYLGSSIESQPQSIQSYHIEELRVHLPNTLQDEHDLYFSNTRDVDSHSRSSRCSSKGDLQYQSHDGSQNQLQGGTTRNHSAGSMNHYSWSSQTSSDHTDKSYPSSLAVSGHQAKKAVLQSSGHLKISAYWNVGLLTIHVIQARCLSSSWTSHCHSYVKMSLVPDESRRTRCKTRIQLNSNNPVFDEKFSLEILDEDKKKRLLISVWHKDPGNGASEFLGCMSFGVNHLLQKNLDGWYYLLTEEAGRKKHLQAHNKSTRPVLASRSSQNIPQINRAVDGQEKILITIARGKNGFGFSFVDEFPPKVGRVDRASPAEHAGVKKGDMVVKINGQNVSRSTCEGVAHLVKKMNPSTLSLELLRDHIICTTTEITATGTHHQHQSSSSSKRGVGTSTDNLYESIDDKAGVDHHKENRIYANGSVEEDYLTDDSLTYSHVQPNHQRITSTPRFFVGPRHKAVNAPTSYSLSKHESIHRLMSLELEYIDFMHYGIERYSRPLRHSILSANQHMVIFQNVEKLVTISEYHIKQMQENNSSVNSDTDDSQSSQSSMFPNSVALIYHSKIHMLSQAYEAYANGLSKSNELLREMRRNQDFMNFIKEPDFADEQCPDHPSVSAFINRPVFHIQEMYSVLNEVFSATPIHSPDFANLQQIIIKLSQCIYSITGLSTAGRVESLDSLTSSQGMTSSGKGSMASLSSTCSSSEADVRYPLFLSSATSMRSIDKDMRHLYETLIFGPDVQAFQLLQEGRHLIYRGDIYRYSKGLWFKSQLLLFSDILLIANEESDGSLLVINNPIIIQSLAGIEVNRKYASEFVLYFHESTSATLPRRQKSSACSSGEKMKFITLRAPSTQEKFMWKSLLEQRVATFNGSKLQHYGSMKDISNVKTSIIL